MKERRAMKGSTRNLVISKVLYSFFRKLTNSSKCLTISNLPITSCPIYFLNIIKSLIHSILIKGIVESVKNRGMYFPSLLKTIQKYFLIIYKKYFVNNMTFTWLVLYFEISPIVLDSFLGSI